MGQSMDKPDRASHRHSHSRILARSLQRSSMNSGLGDRRSSLSASRTRPVGSNLGQEQSEVGENTQMRNGELFLMSRHEEVGETIKEQNQMRAQRLGPASESSQLSPNFRELAESGQEYGLGQWGVGGSKQEPSHEHNHHHDVTISFSKTKHLANNPFHEEEDPKSNLKQILEYDEDSQAEMSCEPPTPTPPADKYLPKEIDKISAIRSVYSDQFSKPNSPANSQDASPTRPPHQYASPEPKRSQLESRIDRDRLRKERNNPTVDQDRLVAEQRGKAEVPETGVGELNVGVGEFNDYDCDFRKKGKEDESSSKKLIRMSKNIQDLKEKICRPSLNKSKESLRTSLQNLNLSRKSVLEGSEEKARPVLHKVQCIDLKIDNIQQQEKMKPQVTQREESEVKGIKDLPKIIGSDNKSVSNSKIKRCSLVSEKEVKVQSSESMTKGGSSSRKSANQEGKNPKQPTQILLFNENNTYVYQNLVVHEVSEAKDDYMTPSKKAQPKPKQTSFTQMVKKEHFGNITKNKNSQQPEDEVLKYSHVETKMQPQPVYLSTCEAKQHISPRQDYQFFHEPEGARGRGEGEKPKEKLSRIAREQINSLKQITMQLNSKDLRMVGKKPINLLQPQHNMQGSSKMIESQNSSSQESSLRRNKTYQEKSSSCERLPANLTAMNYNELVGNFQEYMLRDALGRQREGREKAREEKRHKSSDHSTKVNGVRSKLLVF